MYEAFEQEHDPDGVEDWTVDVFLNPGEELTDGTVALVDENSQLVSGSDLNLDLIQFGQIAGTRWGVTAWVSGGGAQPVYFLRYRGQTNSTPLARKFDKTMRLRCRQL